MKTLIIDYGSGNIESVTNALELVGADDIIISSKAEDLQNADRLILPGVSAFADCMGGLEKIDGLVSEIKKQAIENKKPLLGVCAGMQIMGSIGYENGEKNGLDFIAGKVKKIEIPTGSDLKVPHMGWNNIAIKPNNHPVLEGIKDGDHFYFANSYHFICENEANMLASVEYGSNICAVIAQDNIVGVQFHPEKSGEPGLKLLKNFLHWN